MVIAGGPAPLIATEPFARYGSGYAVALYILFCAVVSFLAAAMLSGYTDKALSEEYDHVGFSPPSLSAGP